MSTRTGQKTAGQATSRAEWITAGVSAVFLLVVIGYLLQDALRRPPGPPDLVFQVDSVTVAARGYRVHLRARNLGQGTAADAVVRGELRAGTELVEESEVTIDFLPGGGSREAALYFSRDPRQHTLAVRPLGYELP